MGDSLKQQRDMFGSTASEIDQLKVLLGLCFGLSEVCEVELVNGYQSLVIGLYHGGNDAA